MVAAGATLGATAATLEATVPKGTATSAYQIEGAWSAAWFKEAAKRNAVV
jgi:hypothetical protein